MTTGHRAALRTIDDALLAELLRVAVLDAAADEVTPPLTPGHGWTPQRQDWFVAYHRRCRDGLAGPSGEAAWAVVVDGAPMGCVRLKRTAEAGVLEVGIWLRRSARGRGIGSQAMTAVLAEASAAGASAVVADTASGNRGACALLRAAGFTLTESQTPDGRVGARRTLTD
ncbi:GNAT family N-acetyltransferase [Brachybacterium hainanense]|uniref:GNAT family N-acetyltransferase n=1 Tax=Brachybacterium hainanense TaxID=1541174 RepID=A0ABV6RDA3_9MICO